MSIRNRYLPVEPFVPPRVIQHSPDPASETSEVVAKEESENTTDTVKDPAPSVVASEPKLSASVTTASSGPSTSSQPTVDSSWISVQDSQM